MESNNCNGNISLRDYLASHESLSDFDLHSYYSSRPYDYYDYIAKIKEEPLRPNFYENPLGFLEWQARMRAIIKYMRADAMLAVRDQNKK